MVRSESAAATRDASRLRELADRRERPLARPDRPLRRPTVPDRSARRAHATDDGGGSGRSHAIRGRRIAVAAIAAGALIVGVVVGASSIGSDDGLAYEPVVASVFDENGQRLACGGRLSPEDFGVAHRTLACGTKVHLRYQGREMTVPVVDRGPFVRGRTLDLTGATASALGFEGVGKVEWAR